MGRMELGLYVKEGGIVKFLKVPQYVVRDLLRDRLSESELRRIQRLAEPAELPSIFKAGSVVADFSNKTATCFQAGLRVQDLEPTWKVAVEKLTLDHY